MLSFCYRDGCIDYLQERLQFVGCLDVSGSVFKYAAAIRGGIGERLSPAYGHVEQRKPLNLAHCIGGFLVVAALGIGGIEDNERL